MARKYNWKTGCDVEATLSVIGGRWKPVLVCHLLEGRKRFGELRRLTPNATERMITLQLRELEADGVVARHVFAEVPPRVEYELTEFGRSLDGILTWLYIHSMSAITAMEFSRNLKRTCSSLLLISGP